MSDTQYDKLLKIHTTGRDDSHSDTFRYPNEPTPYEVLERLARSGYLTKKNKLLEYGCGKGRVDFYLAFQVKCRCIGVEYEERIYDRAMQNKESGISGGRVELVRTAAEDFDVPSDVDRLYFFNPFSVEILKKVMSRVLVSWYENPRELLLFFYYPSDEYVPYLLTREELMFADEISCEDLFPGDSRERILVFEMG